MGVASKTSQPKLHTPRKPLLLPSLTKQPKDSFSLFSKNLIYIHDKLPLYREPFKTYLHNTKGSPSFSLTGSFKILLALSKID